MTTIFLAGVADVGQDQNERQVGKEFMNLLKDFRGDAAFALAFAAPAVAAEPGSATSSGTTIMPPPGAGGIDRRQAPTAAVL